MIREFVRRSYLALSPFDRDAINRSHLSNADAIVVNLHAVPYEKKAQVRPDLRGYLPLLGRGGSEVFVHVSQAYLYADAEAAVWPGINGVLISYPETAKDIQEADQVLTEMEKKHGVDVGSSEIVVILGTAKGVWNIREVLPASPRVTTVALDESRLLMDLRVLPEPEEDPIEYYARGRVPIEAAGVDEFLHGHQGVYRLGMGFPLSSFPKLKASSEEVRQAAKVAKENGFNGALCFDEGWVEPCNKGFTPTDDEIAYHRMTRETYATGLEASRGAVRLGTEGRFVERPVDELAKKIIKLREMCDQRDAEKEAARRAVAAV